jgi:hypothetical protein
MRSECPFPTSFVRRGGSLAIGAAGVHLGPRAFALAADLNKAKGLSMRKTCAVLRDCFGLQLSPGGLSQAMDRLAAKVKPPYDALATELRQAPALPSDETSWWVAGPGWWLWVFTTQLLTFYVVAQSRGRDLLNDILGKDFGGVWSATVWRSTMTPLRSNRNPTPIIIKPSVKPKTFTHSRARASYAKWPPCCVPPSHSKSRKLSLVRKPSAICVWRCKTKLFNYSGIRESTLTENDPILGCTILS